MGPFYGVIQGHLVSHRISGYRALRGVDGSWIGRCKAFRESYDSQEVAAFMRVIRGLEKACLEDAR